MKLVLVSSPARESPEALSLGAASVAAALSAAPSRRVPGAELLSGLEVALLEGRPEEGPGALASRIASMEPFGVGFSVYSWNRGLFAEASRALRAALPDAVLFAGGPEATADPVSFLGEAGLDFAVAGEGESATVAAMSALLGGRRKKEKIQ